MTLAEGSCGADLAVACAACGAARATSEHGRAGEVATGVTDLVSPRIGLVGLGAGPGGSGPARLVLTTNGGTFTSIGPRTARLTEPDSIFFLGREHGWFATVNVLSLAEKIYRTSDGGRSWRVSAAPGHNLAAGSGDAVQFLTPADGWLMDVVANAPAEQLFRTTDGGATWHLVASLQAGVRHGAGMLPELGRIEFEPGGRTGWLGGGMFSSALYRTGDGGHTWRPVSLQAPHGAVFGLPAIYGRTLVEPVTVGAGGRASLRVYVSADGGAAWSLASSLSGAASPSCLGPVPTSFPGRSAGWAAVFRRHHVVVYRTASQGRRWTALVTPVPLPRVFCGPDQITALGANRAWLVAPGTYGSNQTRIYATSNAGLTWRRIDLAALAAG